MGGVQRRSKPALWPLLYLYIRPHAPSLVDPQVSFRLDDLQYHLPMPEDSPDVFSRVANSQSRFTVEPTRGFGGREVKRANESAQRDCSLVYFAHP